MLLSYVLMLASIVVLVLFVHHAGQDLRVAGPDRPRRRPQPRVHRPRARRPARRHRRPRRDRRRGARQRGPCRPRRRSSPPRAAGGLRAGAGARRRRLRRRRRAAAPGASRHPVGRARTATPAPRLRAEDVAGHVLLGAERVHTEDLAYGFRKLVDIAVRSIAQPFNDPTTTVQALHRLHDLLRRSPLAPCPAASTATRTAWCAWSSGRVSWDGYVRLAFDEIRLAGASEPQVTRKMCAALADLKTRGTARPTGTAGPPAPAADRRRPPRLRGRRGHRRSAHPGHRGHRVRRRRHRPTTSVTGRAVVTWPPVRDSRSQAGLRSRTAWWTSA